MGDPASHRISRVRQYSRSVCTIRLPPSPTGLSPAPAGPSSAVRLTGLGWRGPCRVLPNARSTPMRQRRQPRAPHGFGLFPVRSPLLRESSLFLGVREMFQFPRFPPKPTLGSHLPVRGCPIRTSPDHRVPAPPRRISSRGHVLRRLQAPRHPPDALLRGSRARPRGTMPVPMDLLRDARGDPPASRSGLTAPRPHRGGLLACPRFCRIGWSRGDSNPGPPPCKGGALPAKLRPPMRRRGLPPPASGWARQDSNLGPRPYQGRALTT